MANQCTQAEWKILELLWEQGGMSAGQLTRAVDEQAGWTQHAVHTLIKRMLQKELIELDECTGAERYVCRLPKQTVSIEQSAVCTTMMQRLKARLAGGGTYK